MLADPPLVPDLAGAGGKPAAPTGGGVPGGGDEPLYQSSPKDYPQSIQGSFRRIKWAVLVVTLGVYCFWARERVRSYLLSQTELQIP